MPIKGPTDHPDDFINLQEAMHDRLRDLMDEAVAAGWGRDQVSLAIAELNNAWYLALAENDRTEAQIAAARRSKTHH